MTDRYDIGRAGEALVAAYYEQTGHTVIKSTDPFDPYKDMTIDGLATEVKTQTLYRNFTSIGNIVQPAFTVDIAADTGKIHSNQLNKCMNVARLIFVRKSSEKDRVVRIYEAPALGERNFSIIKNKYDGRYVAGFLLKDLKEIVAIDKKHIVEYFMDNYKVKKSA